jgi:hypothetical protein
MKHYLTKIGISLMILALVSLTALTVLAHTRPIHLVEHGTLTPVANQPGHFTAEGTGTATHLGSIIVHRTLSLTPSTDGSGLVDVEGEATLVASNGDELRTGIEGTLNPETGHAVLVYEWEGGTGRFQNATGITTWQVDVNADQTYDVVADGVIKY